MAGKNLAGLKARIKLRYDRKAVHCTFSPGDLVFMFAQGPYDQLWIRFTGPSRVLKHVGEVNQT